ncbi:MAG TPA: cytochrome d ubiquinol oxidase subunit II [Rubrivivax sp.]|nr:cytochrome d ubiquinol oxidase subunit II [Rubrivivax sp.]
MDASNLALFWAGVIAVAIGVYVVLDGFDLGVGILFGLHADEAERTRMMDSIAPFWDGNETWLVVIGASLYAAFPAVYAVFLGAFYLPVLLLLFGLIFRGVAFEFRLHSTRLRAFWDWGFCLGSAVAAFVQGAAVGAMMRGIPVADGQFAGSAFDWLAPFPVFTGIGLVLGYALLGAGWLVMKTDGALRAWALRRVRWLAGGLALTLALAFLMTLDHSVLARSNLHLRPWGLVFPLLGAAALLALPAAGARHDALPFVLTVAFFAAAYLSLGVMYWPYMVPYAITVADAAAPEASLSFLFWGAGLFVLPVIAAYTIGVYWIFRGKTR